MEKRLFTQKYYIDKLENKLNENQTNRDLSFVIDKISGVVNDFTFKKKEMIKSFRAQIEKYSKNKAIMKDLQDEINKCKNLITESNNSEKISTVIKKFQEIEISINVISSSIDEYRKKKIIEFEETYVKNDKNVKSTILEYLKQGIESELKISLLIDIFSNLRDDFFGE